MDKETCYKAVLARDRHYDGRFFTAVLTTGIFCRPICPARAPKAENCRFMPTAAAAMAAGFRPCLRCRPELSPDYPGWHGTSTTVTRALRYISDGFLNDHNIPQLALKLGMGERHLRRLFHKHIGTSPGNVALTRRLLLAKQLLTESSLAITDVADAAGFQSVRRFNDCLKHNFRLSPSDIRQHHNNPRQNKPAALTLKLGYGPPYNWPTILNYLAPRAIPGVELVKGNQYCRLFELNGRTGSFTITPVPATDKLAVTLHNAEITALPLILSRIRHIFGLDANINMINRHLSGHPDLKARIGRNPGIRLVGAWDPFELTVRTILGQQVTVAAATTLSGRLVRRHGLAIDGVHAGLSHIFPGPEILKNADLAGLGITGNRTKAIHHLAYTLCEDPDFFRHDVNLPDFIARMCRLPGIGAWTAHYVAMRAVGETDAFPASDLVLRKRLEKDGRRPTARQLEAISECWRPWRAYAAMYLWNMENDDDPTPPD